ncbi:hypothetical protein [Ralstonia sp. UBA689]|uniref:hypothetical protein n=1 Tax=Ralstonia sp. UBA689 TaxID=1947373 RepID=UPI0025D01336|nr:hypothetical protein [Ralstonia sp. UBA689]
MGEAKRRKSSEPNYGLIPKGVVSADLIQVNSSNEKFLYLTQVDWADAWIRGGEVPISLASSYLSGTRSGIFTPDENTIHRSPVDLRSLRPAFHLENVRNISIVNSSINGVPIPNIINADYYVEDGLILSFCNDFSAEIARRMGKRACVKILNIADLKANLDHQIGLNGTMANCGYTHDHQRNHFLKSVNDAWQKEYRLFWSGNERRTVTIPPNTAALVATFQ